MKKKFKFLLKLLVSILLISWLVFKVDWREVVSSVLSISLGYLALYIAFILLGIFISSHKWKILADFKGIRLKQFDFFKFYLAGTFINNFMPSFLGGDVYRTYRIGAVEGKYSQAASSVLLDRFTGSVALCLLVVVFALLDIGTVLENKIFLAIVIPSLGFFLLSVIFFHTKNIPFFKKPLPYVPQKLIDFMQDAGSYKKSPQIIWRAIGWSAVFNLVGVAGANFILFASLGIQIGLADFLSVIFIISIVSSIPISVNNIGVKEWAYVAFFGFFGLSASVVVTAAILSRFIQMLISFTALPVYLEGKKME